MTDREVMRHLGNIIYAAIYKNGGQLILPKEYIKNANSQRFEVKEEENDYIFIIREE